jgi:hypothetical protein
MPHEWFKFLVQHSAGRIRGKPRTRMVASIQIRTAYLQKYDAYFIKKQFLSKNIRDLYRRINDFKKGYQPRSNLVKDENGDLLADSHNILNRWKYYLSQLWNVHRVSDVRQIEKGV